MYARTGDKRRVLVMYSSGGAAPAPCRESSKYANTWRVHGLSERSNLTRSHTTAQQVIHPVQQPTHAHRRLPNTHTHTYSSDYYAQEGKYITQTKILKNKHKKLKMYKWIIQWLSINCFPNRQICVRRILKWRKRIQSDSQLARIKKYEEHKYQSWITSGAVFNVGSKSANLRWEPLTRRNSIAPASTN